MEIVYVWVHIKAHMYVGYIYTDIDIHSTVIMYTKRKLHTLSLKHKIQLIFNWIIKESF